MIEGGSGLASGNGAVSYRRWVCLHGVFGYQLNQVHGVPKSMALCTGFHCQYQLGTRIIIRVQLPNVQYLRVQAKTYLSKSAIQDWPGCAKFLASFAHGILITDR